MPHTANNCWRSWNSGWTSRGWTSADFVSSDDCILFIRNWKSLLRSTYWRGMKFGTRWVPNSLNQFGGCRPSNWMMQKDGWFRLTGSLTGSHILIWAYIHDWQPGKKSLLRNGNHSILDNLQRFLLEMGHGFCFEARQKRILIDGDYFFADLVFYHRILKCHVIVELNRQVPPRVCLATEPVPQLLQGGSDAARRQSTRRHPALHREGRYDGEVRHRRVRPQHLCAEIHDRTSKRGRNKSVHCVLTTYIIYW